MIVVAHLKQALFLNYKYKNQNILQKKITRIAQKHRKSTEYSEKNKEFNKSSSIYTKLIFIHYSQKYTYFIQNKLIKMTLI